MSNKNLAILGAVAAVMVLLAVVISGISGKGGAAPGGPAYLIQGLDPADVGKIVVSSGEEAVTLQRRGKGFIVVDKDGYPADVKEINELFKKCLDIKTVELATENPANHEDLEVTEDKARTVVKFYSNEPNAPMLAGVAIGKSTETGGGTYVRLLPSDKVYISLESPWIRDRDMDYIDQDLISVKEQDINSVTVSIGGQKYTLRKDAGDNVALDDLPAGKKLKTSDAKSVLRAITDLRFDDVTKSVGGLAFSDYYRCRLNDLTVYTVNIAKKDDKTYVTCSAEFTGERPRKERKVESEEQLKKKEALLLAFDKAEEFTAKHKGWIYEVPDWKARNLTKKLSDLLEDVEKPKDANEAEAKPADKVPESKPADANTPSAGESRPVPAEEPKAAEPNTVEPEAVEPNAVEAEATEPKSEDPNAGR